MSAAIPLSDSQTLVCILCLLAAPLAAIGLSLTNVGLGRLRNASHAAVAALAIIATSVVTFVAIGHTFAGWTSGPAHILSIASKSGAKSWDWSGAAPLFFAGTNGNARAALEGWLAIEAVAIACLIPLGAVADRWRLAGICGATVLSSAFILPLYLHGVWGGGWLSQLGQNYSLGAGLLDAGGSGVIHAAGGAAALALVWLIGPRRGRYSGDGMPMAVPGHNSVFAVLGCLLGLPGWIALHIAGSILFAAATLDQLPQVAINTLASAAAAALAAAAVTRAKYGKPDASLTANGWTAGIAAIAAGCASAPPALALLTGLVSGGIVTFAVELLDLRFEIDDPGGAIPVHLIGGLLGLASSGFFAPAAGQFLAQTIGIATLIGFLLPLTWCLYALLDRRIHLRVDREGEHQGMDLHELGAGAYPEFVTHSDDYPS